MTLIENQADHFTCNCQVQGAKEGNKNYKQDLLQSSKDELVQIERHSGGCLSQTRRFRISLSPNYDIQWTSALLGPEAQASPFAPFWINPLKSAGICFSYFWRLRVLSLLIRATHFDYVGFEHRHNPYLMGRQICATWWQNWPFWSIFLENLFCLWGSCLFTLLFPGVLLCVLFAFLSCFWPAGSPCFLRFFLSSTGPLTSGWQ